MEIILLIVIKTTSISLHFFYIIRSLLLHKALTLFNPSFSHRGYICYGYSRPLRRNSNTIGDYPVPHSDHNFKLCKILICDQVTTSRNPISVQRFHICEIMLVTLSEIKNSIANCQKNNISCFILKDKFLSTLS